MIQYAKVESPFLSSKFYCPIKVHDYNPVQFFKMGQLNKLLPPKLIIDRVTLVWRFFCTSHPINCFIIALNGGRLWYIIEGVTPSDALNKNIRSRSRLKVAPRLTRQFPTQKGIYILFVICFDYVDFQFKKLYLWLDKQLLFWTKKHREVVICFQKIVSLTW